MLIVVSNFIFTFAACGALFLIWRRYIVPQPHGWIVTVGFLTRALVGQLLFWVSYLELPVGSRLQLGDGLWFFARDALLYLPPAFGAASQGLDDIVTLSPTLPSLAFIQTLSFFSLCFGKVVSVALLLNLFAYLGTSIMVLRWSDESPVATLISVTAISLSPAAILWAAQPLKDTLFQFLVIGFVAAAGLWQRASRRGGRGKLLAPGMLMAAALFAVAGIRWYYALAALVALTFFLALIIVRSAGRRTGAILSSLALLVVLAGAFLAGGRAYIPAFLTDLFRPATVGRGVAVVAHRMGQSIEGARGGFDRVGGTTQITAAAPERQVVPASERTVVAAPARPAALAPSAATATARSAGTTPEPTPVAAPERAAVTTPERAAGSTSAVTAEQRQVVPAPERTVVVAPARPAAPDPSAVTATARSAGATPEPTPVVVAPERAAGSTSAVAAPVAATATVSQPPPTPVVDVPVAAVAPSPARASRSGVPLPVEAAPRAAPQVPAATASAPAVVPQVVPTPPRESSRVAEKPATATERSSVAAPPGDDVSGESIGGAVDPSLPSSRRQRLLAGAVAIFVPHFVSKPLGWLNVQGGRGLMWFADVDTLFFDVAIIAIAITLFRRGSFLRFGTPLLWLVVLTTLFVGAPMAYAVSNFGTLFRLRAMVFIGITLLPLVALRARGDSPDVLTERDGSTDRNQEALPAFHAAGE